MPTEPKQDQAPKLKPESHEHQLESNEPTQSNSPEPANSHQSRFEQAVKLMLNTPKKKKTTA